MSDLTVMPIVPVSRGDYLACWPQEPGGMVLEAAPFASAMAPILAPLIALEDGDPGRPLRVMRRTA